MTREVTELLEKRRWTGEEAGKAIIFSLIHSYKSSLEGKSDNGLFSASSLKSRTSDFFSTDQMQKYNRYAVLSSWISQYQAMANAHIQQVTGQIMLLEQIVTVALFVEKEILKLNANNYGNNIIGGSFSVLCGAAQFTNRSAYFSESVNRVNTARELLEESLYWLHGYNIAVKLIAKVINIPDFSIFCTDMVNIYDSVTRLNSHMSSIVTNVKKGEFGSFSKDDACFISDLMRVVDSKSLTPPNTAISAAMAMLKDDMKAFEKQDGVFIGLLTERA